ncbi:hypothetical protein EWI07_06200 [Sporolactobacillus sp. THM7-4]|nr:hypothetical protein EWI07_06200 [Sporolactobacillus sp. THM7-4]
MKFSKIGTAGLAGIIGFVAGLSISRLQFGRLLSSEKVLRLVRKAVIKKIPIDGAWIYMTPQTLTRNALTRDVYKGGLTAPKDGSIQHFDFVADAKTGTLLELKEQST